jgi:hypothetical protein
MVLGLEDAVTVLNKWKDDSAQILVVSESPFQQSRRGILEQGIDWAIGLQGKVSKVSVNSDTKGKKLELLCLRRPAVLCRSPSAFVPLCTKNHGKPSPWYETKLSLRLSRHSLCSFRRTRFLCSTNCGNLHLRPTFLGGVRFEPDTSVDGVTRVSSRCCSSGAATPERRNAARCS